MSRTVRTTRSILSTLIVHSPLVLTSRSFGAARFQAINSAFEAAALSSTRRAFRCVHTRSEYFRTFPTGSGRVGVDQRRGDRKIGQRRLTADQVIAALQVTVDDCGQTVKQIFRLFDLGRVSSAGVQKSLDHILPD